MVRHSNVSFCSKTSDRVAMGCPAATLHVSLAAVARVWPPSIAVDLQGLSAVVMGPYNLLFFMSSSATHSSNGQPPLLARKIQGGCYQSRPWRVFMQDDPL
ncbi:exported protein of unknown function [Pseudomonas sp. JV241A]|nr:exported protein of unknown function [Pseudomonas sp. JV241A]